MESHRPLLYRYFMTALRAVADKLSALPGAAFGQRIRQSSEYLPSLSSVGVSGGRSSGSGHDAMLERRRSPPRRSMAARGWRNRESVLSYADKQGFLVLAVGDELMEIKNRPGFEPKRW
jgi:hypothetical protein